MIWFQKDKVIGVGVDCSDDFYSKLNGIACHDFIDKIIDKFGQSEFVSTSDDKLSKFYNYPQYNVSYLLKKATVDELWLIDSIAFKKGIGFLNEKPRESTLSELKKENKSKSSTKEHNENIAWNETKLEEIPEKNSVENPTTLAETTNEVDTNLDHCAPDLSKEERLKRLSTKGIVRETGYQTYSTGIYHLRFNGPFLASCR